MTPMAWLVGMLGTLDGTQFIWGGIAGQVVATTLLISAVAAYIYAYIYFMKNDADRLGTEAFIMQRERLRLESKGALALPPDESLVGNPVPTTKKEDP